MLEYRRRVGEDDRAVEMVGSRCERCGYTQVDNDDDLWKAAGL